MKKLVVVFFALLTLSMASAGSSTGHTVNGTSQQDGARAVWAG